jgi:predicted DNA-binding ribbon-helix-helix protein
MPPTISGKPGPDNSVVGANFVLSRLPMKSPNIKHSIAIAGRKTSVSLERAFSECLREIAKQRNETLTGLVSRINADRQLFNLSSAIRVFILDYYRNVALRGQPQEAAPTSEAGSSPRSAPNP